MTSWQEHYETRLATEQSFRDEVLTFGQMKFSVSNCTHNLLNGFYLSELAFSQLCKRLGVRTKYANRCPGWLREDNLCYWLGDTPQHQALLRRQGNKIRAFLGPNYGIVNHSDVLEAIQRTVGQDLEPRLVSLEDELCRIVGADKNGPLDTVGPQGEQFLVCLTMVNSELGLGPVAAFYSLLEVNRDPQARPQVFLATTRLGASRRHVWARKKVEMRDAKLLIPQFDAMFKDLPEFRDVAEEAVYDALHNQVTPVALEKVKAKVEELFGQAWMEECWVGVDEHPGTAYDLAKLICTHKPQKLSPKQRLRTEKLVGALVGI